MKSSIATRSAAKSIPPGANAAVPLVMRTLVTTGSLNSTPRKDSVSFAPTTLGTDQVPRKAPPKPKKLRVVASAMSTSVKTAPNPLVNACVVVPGMKKLTSTMLLPSAVKRRCAENVSKVCV